jgi:DNA-binding PadR family transcriptional regulator
MRVTTTRYSMRYRILLYTISHIINGISMGSSKWLNKLNKGIPRGLSRYYILSLLSEQQLTGQEIMEKIIIQSTGRWKPSPGLLYPILGRLFKDGFIEETKDGKYKITTKGLEITTDLRSIKTALKKPFEILARVKYLAKFMVRKLLERLSPARLPFSKKGLIRQKDPSIY